MSKEPLKMPKDEKEAAAVMSAAYARAQEEQKERILDPLDEFFLAGVLPFEEGEYAEYVPLAFRKLAKEDQGVFFLDALSREDVAAHRKAIAEGGDRMASIITCLKRSGVKGWNLKSRKGTPIAFDIEKIGRFGDTLLEELFAQCWAYATGILPVEAEGLESSLRSVLAASHETV